MAQGIYMEDGSFKAFSSADLQTEIANRHSELVFSNAWLGVLPDPDPILRKQNNDAQILMDLLADDQVTTAITSRKNRVLNSSEYGFSMASFDGADAGNAARLVFDRLTKDLERLKMRTLISSVLDAPYYGIVPLEITWEANGTWWHIKNIEAKPYYWFAFDENNMPFFKGDFRLGRKELPAGKFVFAQHNATYDNPYGIRLLSRCLWPVSFKRGGLQFYAKFVEKYGIPWTIGKAPRGATKDEKREIACNLARMVEDAVAVIPMGADVELISPPSQTGSMHEDFLARQDRAISKIIMGQTLTLEMEGKNNSQAVATTHKSVADDIAKSDKDLVCEVMNEIAWTYTMLNVGENVLSPIFSFQEPKDLLERAKLDRELFSLGVRFTHQHFIDEYGLKEDEFTLIDPAAFSEKFPVPDTSIGSFSAKPSPKNTETKNQLAFEKTVAKLLPEAVKANDEFINRLLGQIQKAKSFDELETVLIENLGSELAVHELKDFLSAYMIQAKSFGQYAAQNEGE